MIDYQNLTSGYYYDVCRRPSWVDLSPLGERRNSKAREIVVMVTYWYPESNER